MSHRHFTAVLLVSGVIAVAACGIEDAELAIEAERPAPLVDLLDDHPGYVYSGGLPHAGYVYSGGLPDLHVVTPVRW